MHYCKCTECGITKTKFVKMPSHREIFKRVTRSQKKGAGIGETVNKKIGEKIPGFSQAQNIYTYIPGVDKNLFKKYWSGDIAKGAFKTKTELFWTHPDPKKEKGSCNYAEKINGKWVNHYCS